MEVQFCRWLGAPAALFKYIEVHYCRWTPGGSTQPQYLHFFVSGRIERTRDNNGKKEACVNPTKKRKMEKHI